MLLSHFSFSLPETLIAHYPLLTRSQCRLMSLDGTTGAINHGIFTDLTALLTAGDLLVLNNTKVIPARMFGHKASGGKVEILLERILTSQRALVQVRSSKKLRIDALLTLGDQRNIYARVMNWQDGLCELYFEGTEDVLTLFNKFGHMPLPPYINRSDETLDKECYQTLYSKYPGSVAAPTAGLHFDNPLLLSLREKGIEIAFVTLHIGAGTFQPVRAQDITQHVMHAEHMVVEQSVVDAVLACKKRGNRVVAVGTTAVRSLETAAQCQDAIIAPFFGATRIFIYPGFQYKIVDALITNFHLPESTLLMLVAAFAGFKNTMAAYREAIEQQYRFFSYGDAMFITRNIQAAQESIV